MVITIDHLSFINAVLNTGCNILIGILLISIRDELQITNNCQNYEEREIERIRLEERFKKSFMDGAMISLLLVSIYFLFK